MKVQENGHDLDYAFIGSLASLIIIGVLLVYSATATDTQSIMSTHWFKQVIYFGAGTMVAVGFALTKPVFFHRIAYPLYIISLIALAYLAMGGGKASHGAGRWIPLGGLHIQPSEFAKIAYLLALSRLLVNRRLSLNNLKGFIAPGLLFVVPFLLILKQPDLSTALVFMVMTLAAFYWSGLTLPEIFLLISPGVSVIATVNQLIWGALIVLVTGIAIKIRLKLQLILVIVLLNMSMGYASFLIWNSVLQDHQRSRILTFIDPLRDPKGAGYQVIQSKVAIGSGGLFGKGFGKGSQTNLSFLPEEHTDFIFSVLGEQFGFAGSVFVLFLYFIFLQRSIHICTLHGDRFLNLVVVGACSILLFHVFVNIAMTLGMMPVTGLPLPFLSYGGSFVLTCMALVGLLLSMRLQGHRF